MGLIQVFCLLQVMQIRCKSAVCQCHRYQRLTLMELLGHVCNSVQITRLNNNFETGFCQKKNKKASGAELCSDQLLLD